jgi:hypothetical protein
VGRARGFLDSAGIGPLAFAYNSGRERTTHQMGGNLDASPPIFIHVGFANTGTTSLQWNFFSMRDDIFYVGEPYGECGGIFTMVKNIEDFNLDLDALEQLCDRFIFKKSGGRPIVISDEALSETPQLYFAPYTMPRDTIALRLQELFRSPKIIFTIRDQRHYVESMYLNLKRNCAQFDHMPVAPFSNWLTGALSLWRAHYLQNLNFAECISLYARIFGRENICVMPLEMAATEGPEVYLGRICAFMGLPLRTVDVANFSAIRNRRMSAREALVAELRDDERFDRLYTELCDALGPERLAAVLDDGPRCAVAMRPSDEMKIRQRIETGNWLLAREFALDLAGYGYPLAQGYQLSRRQLALAEREFAFERDTERLHRMPDIEAALEIRRSAEIRALQAQLRQMAGELDTVGSSPVWRTVKRLERARRFVSRAATTVLGTGRKTLATIATRGSSNNRIAKNSASNPIANVSHEKLPMT